jgi:hypothetical protein
LLQSSDSANSFSNKIQISSLTILTSLSPAFWSLTVPLPCGGFGIPGVRRALIQATLAALDQSANAGSDIETAEEGPETIGGRETERIIVSSPEGNWQVWLAGKGTRHPVRLITASIDDPRKIAQTNEFEWKNDPVLVACL